VAASLAAVLLIVLPVQLIASPSRAVLDGLADRNALSRLLFVLKVPSPFNNSIARQV
jgi:hypothetical protein